MKPTYKLSVAESEIKKRLKSLTATDRAGFAGDTLTLVLYANNLAIPSRGENVTCEIGYEETGTWTLGSFFVEDVKLRLRGRAPEMVIQCISQPQGESSIAALQTTREERVWQSHAVDGTTFKDVVSKVCSDVGLTARVDDRLASLPMPYTVQSVESDAAFLHRLTVERNGLVKMDGSQVLFTLRDGGGLGVEVIRHDAETMQYEFDITERYDIGSVRAKYQDDALGEVVQFTAGTGKGVKIIPKTFSDRDTAKAAAEALLKHYQRNFIGGTLKLPTRPGLLAEKLVNLTGFPGGEQVNNQFVVVVATHTFSGQGLLSELKLKRPQS